MRNRTRPLLLAVMAALPGIGACGERFSPDVYATQAVQQADRVEQGIIVGVREVRISAEGSTGAATGAAAGGVLGAQAPGGGILSALGGVGGALVGGLIGKGAEHTIVDTAAHEYIVRTTRNELMRVTQQDREPLARGQQVLLITGRQARVVPDYTIAPDSLGHALAPTAAPTLAPTLGPGDAPPREVPQDGAATWGAGLPGPALPAGADPAPPASAPPGLPAYPSVPPPPPAPDSAGAPPRVDSPVTGG